MNLSCFRLNRNVNEIAYIIYRKHKIKKKNILKCKWTSISRSCACEVVSKYTGISSDETRDAKTFHFVNSIHQVRLSWYHWRPVWQSCDVGESLSRGTMVHFSFLKTKTIPYRPWRSNLSITSSTHLRLQHLIWPSDHPFV